MDLQDLKLKRGPLSRIGYTRRVRALAGSQRAQEVAAKCAGGLANVCREVKRKRGAAARSWTIQYRPADQHSSQWPLFDV